MSAYDGLWPEQRCQAVDALVAKHKASTDPSIRAGLAIRAGLTKWVSWADEADAHEAACQDARMVPG